MSKFNFNWENNCLFVLANIGDVNLFEYWLDKKKLNIDAQDEDGDTSLHYAVRGGHIDLVIELLKRGAIMSQNKKKRTPLQDAYAFNQTKVTKEITKCVIQRNSIKNVVQIPLLNKIDNREQQRLNLLVNDFIKCLRKNYLDRNIFIRFPAKHNERAKALIVAVRRCSSLQEFKDLLNNQLNLFKNIPTQPLSKGIINKRWSEVIKNKPLDVNKSQFYKTLNTFVAERLCNNNVNNRRSFKNALHR
jgi:Ankyrin repeats (3 copies)